MSGWIKFEKNLETDPRVLRVAKSLSARFVIFESDTITAHGTYDPCNACAFHYVTLVCGALARLWMYADSHARADDTLDMSAAEIDEWLGLPGFCSLLPDDWLVELPDGRVELPGFQEHNGVEAKKRALTQKRVERHRKAKGNAPALQDEKGCNAPALPDQTRPDQTKTKKEPHGPSDRPSDFDTRFAELQKAYPKRPGHQRWPDARKAIRARLKEGHTWDELTAGVERYARFLEATGRLNTERVQQAATFFGANKGFLEPWEPAPPAAAKRRLTRYEQLFGEGGEPL